MTNEQPSERGKNFTERIADQVAKLPDGFAIPALEFLGRERPNTEVYYPEVDQEILTELQLILNNLGYSYVSIESTGKNSDSLSDYPYVSPYAYRLKRDAQDDQRERKHFSGVCYELADNVKKLGFDLSFGQETGLVFVKLQPKNRMHVAKPHQQIRDDNGI